MRNDVTDSVVGHVETGLTQKLQGLSVFHYVFVHDGGGGET